MNGKMQMLYIHIQGERERELVIQRQLYIVSQIDKQTDDRNFIICLPNMPKLNYSGNYIKRLFSESPRQNLGMAPSSDLEWKENLEYFIH